MNLRGTIVPIVDMRLKFNCAQADYNSFTVVIILNLRDRVVGIVVDSVSDVMELSAENIRSALMLRVQLIMDVFLDWDLWGENADPA